MPKNERAAVLADALQAEYFRGFLERERSGLAVELADCAERLNRRLTKSELSQLMRTISTVECGRLTWAG
jgi:hypothetical protein